MTPQDLTSIGQPYGFRDGYPIAAEIDAALRQYAALQRRGKRDLDSLRALRRAGMAKNPKPRIDALGTITGVGVVALSLRGWQPKQWHEATLLAKPRDGRKKQPETAEEAQARRTALSQLGDIFAFPPQKSGSKGEWVRNVLLIRLTLIFEEGTGSRGKAYCLRKSGIYSGDVVDFACDVLKAAGIPAPRTAVGKALQRILSRPRPD